MIHTKEFDSTTMDASTRRRLLMYAAAAGTGAFGLFGGAGTADAAIVVDDPTDFGRTGSDFRWVDEANRPYGYSNGIDILRDGGLLDVGIFRGPNYQGYLVARTDVVGYYGGTQFGSGRLRLLNNADNPDGDGPANSLDGFNAGEVIGDNDTVGNTSGDNTMRRAYYGGDWQGVPSNGIDPSYIGFEIDIDGDTSFDGFGWIEVIVGDTGSFPEITVTRWAYTDDGSTIQAGQVPEPSTLMLLAAGAGVATRRRRSA